MHMQLRRQRGPRLRPNSGLIIIIHEVLLVSISQLVVCFILFVLVACVTYLLPFGVIKNNNNN